MMMNLKIEQTRAQTRRHFFGQAGLGFGALALSDLLAADTKPAFQIPAKAKSIIYLHMAGSPSQIDLFENKPALTKFHGKECPQEYLEGKRFAFIKGVPKMMGPVFNYAQRGESGQWISSLLPGLSSVINLIPRRPSFFCKRGIPCWVPLRWDRGSLMASGARTRIYLALWCWLREAKLPVPGSRCGARAFCRRFIRECNAAPMGVIPFYIYPIPKE